MELLAIGVVSTGHAVAWFIDPQGGASSPALAKAADWYVDLDGVERMLASLERICEWRSKEMASKGWIGFDPSPERPGITVFIDEAHEVFDKNTDRWTTLARKARKVGIALVVLSQYPGLTTFGGSEPLRAAVMAGNCLAMRTESRQNGQLLPGLEVDPLTLPPIPGFGYTVRRGNEFGRTAPFRAEYVKTPAEWLKKYPSLTLDPVSANAASDDYKNRRSDMDDAMALVRAQVEAMANGDPSAVDGLDKALGALPGMPDADNLMDAVVAAATLDAAQHPEDWVKGYYEPASQQSIDRLNAGKAELRRLSQPSANPLDLPPAPVLTLVRSEPASVAANGREAILAILAKGEARMKELIDGTGLSETRVRQLVGELAAAKQVSKVGRGVYRRLS
jgi:hypothetical protein